MSLEQPLSTLSRAPAQPSESSPQVDTTSVTLMSITAVAEYCANMSSELVRSEEQGSTNAVQPTRSSSPPEPEHEDAQQLIEALKSPKDRIFVLKLAESIERLIQDRHIRNKYETKLASSYHRMLVHRAAGYYKVTPETADNEDGTKTITLIVVAESRIPFKRVADLVPIDETPQPTIQIMRRGPQRMTSKYSQTGSGNEESASGTGDISDDGDGPSEGGSSSHSSRKKSLTMSERQALYEEARSRIFKDLEEKGKLMDMSASSSTLSMMSAGSSSGGPGGGTSSIGESLDDSGSVDREWTGNKDKRDGSRRASSVASNSSRGYRTGGTWTGHAHSPGYVPRSLYDPSAPSTPSSNSSTSSSYHTYQLPNQAYQPSMYPVYQLGAPPYLSPYATYPYYPYGPHHPASVPPASTSDPAVVSSEGNANPNEPYPNPQYVNYAWAPPPAPSEFPQMQFHPPPVHAYTYPGPIPQFFPPVQGPTPMHCNPHSPQPPPQPPQQYSQISPFPHQMPNRSQGYIQPQHGFRQTVPVNGDQGQAHSMNPLAPMFHMGPEDPSHDGDHYSQRRNQLRTGFGYGPSGGEAIGPRMTNTRRTSSGNSVSGSSGGLDTASVASSSTSSSSSAQTFTSTSSAHPSLPARPDWAVGLKPEPTLHHSNSSRHQPHVNHQRPHPVPLQGNEQRSPILMNGGLQRPPIQQRIPHVGPMQPNSSQSRLPPSANDFPPLSMAATNTDRRPVVGGVWAAPPAIRNIHSPPPPRPNNGHPNALNSGIPFYGNGMNSHHLNGTGMEQIASRLDEPDMAYERPGHRIGGQLYNPNAGNKSPPSRPGKIGTIAQGERGNRDRPNTVANMRGEAVANAILVDRVGALRIAQDGDQATTI